MWNRLRGKDYGITADSRKSPSFDRGSHQRDPSSLLKWDSQLPVMHLIFLERRASDSISSLLSSVSNPYQKHCPSLRSARLVTGLSHSCTMPKLSRGPIPFWKYGTYKDQELNGLEEYNSCSWLILSNKVVLAKMVWHNAFFYLTFTSTFTLFSTLLAWIILTVI